MGFTDLADLRRERSRFEEEIKSGHGLKRNDWTRALFITEVIHASDIVGAGLEWQTVTGLHRESPRRRHIRRVRRAT